MKEIQKTCKDLCFETFLFCLGSFFQHVLSSSVFQDASGSACLCLRNSVLLNTLDNQDCMQIVLQ